MSNTELQTKKAKKVLIVEDEGDMCLLLNILLNGEEMQLDHVNSILDAGEYLQKKNLLLLSWIINYRMDSVLISSALLNRNILL